MKVEIICPLHNAMNYILDLHDSLLHQKNVAISKISYALTESTDATEKILQEHNIAYTPIKKDEFSHSLTREKVALNSDSDILVFITQDIKVADDNWLFNLISPIMAGEAAACYSRQISKYNNIEKYTREKNYPQNSFIVSKDDIARLGLKTFFFSDASSAIKTAVFKELNGYDGKDLPTNEDMYIAYKMIMAGYKIKYCAESVVYHSHKFTLRQLYRRYYKFGQFMALNPQIYQLGATKAGGGLAKYILRRAICQFNLPVLIRFIPDMMARYCGMKKGKRVVRANK